MVDEKFFSIYRQYVKSKIEMWFSLDLGGLARVSGSREKCNEKREGRGGDHDLKK